MEAEGEESYFLQDDLGSPLELTDRAGAVRESYAYDEFGAQQIYTGKDIFKSPMQSIQPFGFTGYQMDEAGGLYFAQARRYDAGIGRFISEDKVRGFIESPFTLNHYGYCWSRPLDLVDLDGRFALAALIGAGIGAVAGIAAQAISDIVTGEMPSLKNYVSSAVGGAVGGAVMGFTGSATLAGAASSGTSTLVSGVWDMADGTNEASMNSVIDLAADTMINAGIGAVVGKVSSAAGQQLLKRVPGATGCNSFTSLYKQSDTKIHTGTWHFSSLSTTTWMKSIASETIGTAPSMFFSQLENPLQNFAGRTKDFVFESTDEATEDIEKTAAFSKE